jgi:hypothetical protein
MGLKMGYGAKDGGNGIWGGGGAWYRQIIETNRAVNIIEFHGFCTLKS